VYLMEGNGVITLNGKDYSVGRGAGVYLGPNETVAIRPAGGETLKLFHLVVPEVKDAAGARGA
jgi:mannose-6-phosphate isomerase-like protein (cupin superfamily)